MVPRDGTTTRAAAAAVAVAAASKKTGVDDTDTGIDQQLRRQRRGDGCTAKHRRERMQR